MGEGPKGRQREEEAVTLLRFSPILAVLVGLVIGWLVWRKEDKP
jgi:hypothetical protein